MVIMMATALTILMIVSATWQTVDATGCVDACRLPASRVVVCEIQQGGALKQTFEPCRSHISFHSDPRASCEVCCK